VKSSVLCGARMAVERDEKDTPPPTSTDYTELCYFSYSLNKFHAE